MNNEDNAMSLLTEFVEMGHKKRHPSGRYWECKYCLDSAESDAEHYPDCIWLRAKNYLKCNRVRD